MRVLLTTIATVSLCAAIASGVLDHGFATGAGLIGSLAFLFAANLDRISEFKASGSGFEARTRDVISRAENTIQELQVLATRIAELSLTLVKRTGRGDFSENEEDAIKADILSLLRQLNVPEGQVASALKGWHEVVEFDYAFFILGQGAPCEVDDETSKTWRSLREGGIANRADPESIRKFLQEATLLTPEREALLLDYEHYRKFRKHRRPDTWADRQAWGALRRQV